MVGLAVLIPLVYLFLRAGQADLSTLLELVWRPRNLMLLLNTLLLMLGVLFTSSLISLPLAWLSVRSDFRGKRLMTLLLTLPLAVPGYVGAYALLGASGSAGLIHSLSGLNWPAPSGYFGALGLLTLFTFPYLFLNLRAALRGADVNLEEMARIQGYSTFFVFWRVLLPQLKPAFYAGWLLIGLHVLGDFAVVSLMRYETFSSAIYLQYAASFDRIYAAWLSLFLLALTAIFLFLEAKALKNLKLSRTAIKRQAKAARLGLWNILVYPFLALIIGASLFVPTASIAFWLAREPIFGLGDLWSSLFNSAKGALPAAVLAVLFALPLAYLGVRYSSRLSRIFERVAYLGYAIPPLALALSLIFFTLQTVPALYQTLVLLIIAYTLHFLAEAIGPLRSGLYQTSIRLEEAARTLGLGRLRILRRITLPLLRAGILSSLSLVFLSAMKELPLTFLLAPLGHATLATNIWSYTSEAMFANAAPYALLILLTAGLSVGLFISQEK